MAVMNRKRTRQSKQIIRIRNASILVFVIKLFIIFKISNISSAYIQGHIWLGADGEPYLTSTDGLVQDGFFSNQELLSYWPAGYPLLIYLLSLLGKSFTLTVLSILQSALFSYSAYFFGKNMLRSGFRPVALICTLLILINPTLTLSSMVIGYESIVSSLFLVMLGKIIAEFNIETTKFKIFLSIGVIGFLICLLQPRFLLTFIILISIMVFYNRNLGLSTLTRLVSIAALVILLTPFILVLRNYIAVQMPTISTNLGVTMNIGAGDTTGGYIRNPPGVPCQITESRKDKVDQQKIKCVLSWYFANPKKAGKLFLNKSIYFWSPWFGPEANGTMARNPWLTIHPLKNMQTTKDGIALLYGGVGKLVSWAWMLSGLFLVFYGFWGLNRSNSENKILAKITLTIILTSWFVTLFSIGDHRFRLPILGCILFLESVAIKTLLNRGKINVLDNSKMTKL